MLLWPKTIFIQVNSSSFKTKDNLSHEQKELIELKKQSKQLLMENDLLK